MPIAGLICAERTIGTSKPVMKRERDFALMEKEINRILKLLSTLEEVMARLCSNRHPATFCYGPILEYIENTLLRREKQGVVFKAFRFFFSGTIRHRARRQESP